MSKRLFIGNLSYSTTESSLVNAFAEFGGTNAKVIDGRGFGFVDVPEESMDAAIEKWDGKDLDGRQIRVNEARPREDRGGGGGGGYGGGGGGRDRGGRGYGR